MDSEDDLDGTLQSFMFGNIDQSGRLEDDIFDEESKQHLSCLSNFGLGSLVKELVDSEEADDSANDNEFSEKSENAVDYSDIIETVADTEETSLPESNGDATVVVSQGESVPKAEADSPKQSSDQPVDGLLQEPKEQSTELDGVEGSSKAVLKLNTPLASLLPPELADCDVRQWFPDFHPDRVLRFSRIFRPPYEPNNWKQKKKRKPFGPLSESAEAKPSVTADKTAKPPLPTASTSIREADTRQSSAISTDNVVDNEVVDVLKVEGDDMVIEEDEDEEENYGSLKLTMGRSPRPDELMADDEDLMMRPTAVTLDSGNDSGSNTGLRSEVAEWRYGPAKLWYDMFDVPESGDGFDYGFQLKGDGEEDDDDHPQNLTPLPNVKFSRDAFLMVNLIHWEDDVIFDSSAEKVKDRVDKLLAQKMPYCGWIPSMTYRTYEQFVKHHNPALHGILQEARFFGPGPFVPSKLVNLKPMGRADDNSKKSRPGFYSIFPVENEDLLYSKWEDDVIWDAKKMEKIPCPPVLTFDPNDDSLILEIPEDNIPPVAEPLEQDTKKEKEVKKSKAVLEKAGILKEEEKEQEKEMPIQNKDPFNLSNDESYNPKLSSDQTLGRNLGVAIVQHSTPAVELRSPYFLTHLTVVKLRCFHHPLLKKYQHGPMAPGAGPHPVLPLLKQIKRKEHQREQERMATGGGEMFFMRTSEDLTGRDGDIILAEFSEQYPPLMNQVGMANKIKNYYKRKPGKDSDPPSFKFGDMAYAHTSRFLGSLSPGQCLQAFENNMYRAPVYEHRMPETDILIIRNRMHFYAREVHVIFVIGQQCPLIEVPGPNSKRANNFIRDFLQVFIYRLFWKSKDTPKRIKMDEIRKAFPTHSENTIRKRLKLCADFKRTGADSNWWVLNSSFRLPTEEEMREMVTPEQCCAYYSMLAAEQRLKDAGYGEKSLFAAQDEDNDEETQTKMEDEVKTAPWNTTRAFIAAMKGRCLLDLNGVADPTGCGEGFSYVNVPNKPQQMKDDVATNTPVKKTVTGTDADLRRLPLNEAKQLLRKFGVPESEIKKLSRWEVIDAVRRYSTQQSKACQEGLGGDVISKFARGNRFSVAEHRERYKEECQRIFDLQNRILGSDEVLSTDEDSGSEISDFEEMGKNLETMLCDKKTSSQIRQLREEAGRKELNKMLRENFGKDRVDKKEETSLAEAEKGVRILRITRTFLKDDGGEFTRTEIVRNPQVIDRYIKIRETQNPEIIKQYATNDQQKEEMKKEKRRLQEQLRRMKRQQQIKAGIGMPPPKKRKKELNPVNLLKLQRIKCRACGQTGHMKTNRDCPMFNKIKPSGLVGKVAMSEEQEELLERSNLVDKDLIISEGTKIKVSRHLVEHTEQVKRKSLVLKLPKIVSESKKKRRVGKDVQCDYLKKSNKLANRRRADPVVTLSSIFENILKEMKDLPNVKLFHVPVNAKHVPDYYTIIKKPMDLQTIQNNIRSRKYLSRVAFIVDVSLVVKNSETYNGPKSALTAAAQKMLDFCLQRLTEKEERIMSLEKAINPMLDVDLVSFGYILSGIVEDRMKTVEGSIPFHHPVNKKQCKDYYDLIEQPMDLSTLYKNAKENRYHGQEQFLKHVQLIVSNCEKYNGPASSLTRTAHRLMDVCRQAMKEQEETLRQLEENIRAVQEAAMEGVETDSIVTATSVTGGDAESVKERARHAFDNSSTFGVLSQDPFEADDAERTSRDEEEEEDAGRMSQFEEFVDVEGAEDDDDDKNANESYDNAPAAFVEDSLERDLRMTPERSEAGGGDDEDEDFERQSLKLSSSGSDSEEGEGQSFRADAVNAEMCEYAETNAMYRFDENAQDFNYDALYLADAQPDDGNSFDPQAFFSELVQQERDEFNQDAAGATENDGTNNAQADVNNDLEVSESDESNEGIVPVEDESDQDFNMGDYLNMD